MTNVALDQDAVLACADLARRSGGKEWELGYLHDDVPVEEAGWYAQVKLRGARILVENQPGPVEAADALSRRLLTGAECNHCHEPVALADDAPGCRWTRMGSVWKRGCE